MGLVNQRLIGYAQNVLLPLVYSTCTWTHHEVTLVIHFNRSIVKLMDPHSLKSYIHVCALKKSK